MPEQVQMFQNFPWRRVLRQRKSPGPPRYAHKTLDACGREVRQRRVRTPHRIERAGAHQLLRLQILHQGGIHPGNQFGTAGEAAADHLRPGLPDQRPHLGMLLLVIRAFDENQPMLVPPGGQFKFPFRRRNPLRVLEAVFVAEQAHIDIAPFDLIEINVVRPAVGGGDFFKEKRLKEPAQQRIAAQIIPQRRPFPGELLLHRTDEDAQRHRVPLFAINHQPSTLNQPRPPGQQLLHHALLEGAGLGAALLQRRQLRVQFRQHLAGGSWFAIQPNGGLVLLVAFVLTDVAHGNCCG